MMTKKDTENRFQIEFNSIDALVPKNHLVRKIDASIDFKFIYAETAELYSASSARVLIQYNKNSYASIFIWYTFNQSNY